MITRLRVKNYRCFEDFDWTPDQICLLIGQNGTGKSTLFGLLERLRGMLAGKRSVRNWRASSTPVAEQHYSAIINAAIAESRCRRIA